VQLFTVKTYLQCESRAKRSGICFSQGEKWDHYDF